MQFSGNRKTGNRDQETVSVTVSVSDTLRKFVILL